LIINALQKQPQILLNYMLTTPGRFFNPAASSKPNALPLRESTKIPDLVLLDEFGIYCERVKHE
jgi:hypothetical protein